MPNFRVWFKGTSNGYNVVADDDHAALRLVRSMRALADSSKLSVRRGFRKLYGTPYKAVGPTGGHADE